MSEECIIDPDMLRAWLNKRERKLGPSQDRQRKILINSPWAADKHFHCALIFKGKYGRFRDFKSEKNGSIVDFVMQVDGIEFKEAIQLLAQRRSSLPPLTKPRRRAIIEEDESRALVLPMDCMTLVEKKGPWWVEDAWDYLASRGLNPELHEVYACHTDRWWFDEAHSRNRRQKLAGRVLIPMRERGGTCVFWTARAISGDMEPKYMEPFDAEVKVEKEAVVFAPSWKLTNRPTMLVEGCFCAMALAECGLGVVSTQGCVLYKEQAKQIIRAKARILIAYDRDAPGRRGALEARNLLMRMGVRDIGFIRPPEGHDWSSAHQEWQDREKMRRYVRSQAVEFSERVVYTLFETLPALRETGKQERNY